MQALSSRQCSRPQRQLPAQAGRKLLAVRCSAAVEAKSMVGTKTIKFWKYQGLGNDFILVSVWFYHPQQIQP
jgi:hypothetical protein